MPTEKTFAVSGVSRNVKDFESLAKMISSLKKLGKVEIGIGSLAEKTRADVPEGGSAWHEYTSMLSTYQKVFPHPKMVPFLDMKHVKKNRDLLRAKAKVVKKYGYGASFKTHIPFYLPEAFYVKYPHLRGARCDHPRRSRQEAFAFCVDHPESLEMIRHMTAELASAIPEISALQLSTNDAGAGLCWSDWIYPGPNGPAECKHIPTAQRVDTMMKAIREGAGKERVLDLQMDGNFSPAEWRDMNHLVDKTFHFMIHQQIKGVEHQVGVTGVPADGGVLDNPVRGIFDPVGIVKLLQRTRDPQVTRIAMRFAYNYNRGQELDYVIEKVVEIVGSFLNEPAYGTIERLTFVRKLCEKWVGPKRRDELLEALIAMREAYTLKQEVGRWLTGNYQGVSMRMVNRPLVILPQLLTPAEESYFLPHVFNPDINEARTDYLDWHGGRMTGGMVGDVELHGDPRISALDRFCGSLKQVAATLADMGDSPSGRIFGRMAISLRLYAGVMRSVNNFFATGIVQDRNKEKLLGPPHLPPKMLDWTGDPDLLLLNGYMRDELDNAAEMIRLLENGGMQQVLVADKPEDEDTFLLGPDLVKNMKKKCAIMKRHWIDVQNYMTTPLK